MANMKFIAYSVTDSPGGDEQTKSRWTRVGIAFENKDGSLTLLVDSVPLSGKVILQLPEAAKESPEAD